MAPAKLPFQGIRLSLSSCHFFLLCHWYPWCPGSFTNLSPSLPDQNFTPGFCRAWNEEDLNRLDDVNLKDDVKLVLNTFILVTAYDFRINLISFRTTGRVKTDNRFRPVSLRRFFPFRAFPVTFSLIHVYSGKPSDWLLSTGLFQAQLSHIYHWLLYVLPYKI